MSAQQAEAIKRGLYGAFWLFLSATLATYTGLGTVQASMPEGDRWKAAAIAGGSAFVAYMISRGMAEGLIDTGRAERGDVIEADVRAVR